MLKKMAIISPSSFTSEYDEQKVRLALKSFGYEPVYGENVFEYNRFLAGSDDKRAEDVMWAFTDKTIDAVMTLRGGYGSARLLDKLDYKQIAKHKKPFFGFSDATALQLALWQKSKLISYSGLQASFLQDKLKEPMRESFKAFLSGKKVAWTDLTPVTAAKAKGVLIGGTLSLIVSLIGTPYEPDFKKAILVLEDVGEEPYRVDRMLTQLRLAGVFDKVRGIVLAGWHRCVSKDPFDGNVNAVLHEHFASLKIPVVKKFPYGHGINETIFPIGSMAELDASQGVLKLL